MRNKILITLGLLIVILALTNPTLNDFKSFIPTSRSSDEIKKFGSLGRESNFIVCSIYKLKIDKYNQHHDIYYSAEERYFSILKNFFYIPKNDVKTETMDSTSVRNSVNEVIDSVKSDVDYEIDISAFDSVSVESLINDIPLPPNAKRK